MIEELYKTADWYSHSLLEIVPWETRPVQRLRNHEPHLTEWSRSLERKGLTEDVIATEGCHKGNEEDRPLKECYVEKRKKKKNSETRVVSLSFCWIVAKGEWITFDFSSNFHGDYADVWVKKMSYVFFFACWSTVNIHKRMLYFNFHIFIVTSILQTPILRGR